MKQMGTRKIIELYLLDNLNYPQIYIQLFFQNIFANILHLFNWMLILIIVCYKYFKVLDLLNNFFKGRVLLTP